MTDRTDPASIFGLAPGGVCRASRSPGCWWALTPPFHPYLTESLVRGSNSTDYGPRTKDSARRYLSVALSLSLPGGCRAWTVGVTHHRGPNEPGLSSLRLRGQRPSCRLVKVPLSYHDTRWAGRDRVFICLTVVLREVYTGLQQPAQVRSTSPAGLP